LSVSGGGGGGGGGGRVLTWAGCHNVRDLGGLPVGGGRSVRWGATVRADGVDRLTARGWDALVAHGVRTVIDLRNDEELRPDRAPRPGALETVRVPLDGIEDREFWDVWSAGPTFGTPLYYGPFLERFPERAARVVEAIARARPGGAVYHCSRGRDRTGLVTLALLALLGAEPAAVAADYELSASGVRALSADLGEPDQGPESRPSSPARARAPQESSAGSWRRSTPRRCCSRAASPPPICARCRTACSRSESPHASKEG